MSKVMEARISDGRVVFEFTDDKGKKKNYAHFDYLRGKAKWAKVLEADQYGNYAIDVYPEEAGGLDAIKEEAERIAEEAKGLVEGLKKKVALVADVSKEDSEEVEYIQFKRKEDKGAPKIYNKYGELDEDWDSLVGNGSIVKVGCVLSPYYMAATKTVGVSYKLYAVQVIDLVEYEGGSGNTGFGNEAGDEAPFETEEKGEDF